MTKPQSHARKTTRPRARVSTTKQAANPSSKGTQQALLERWNKIVGAYGDLGFDSIYRAFSRAGEECRNQPQINNARIKAINPLPADYTKEQLGEFLTSPQTSEIPLRQIAQVLRWSAYPFQKVVKSYSDMLTYRHYIKPLYIDGDAVSSEEFKREWRLVDKIEKASGIEELGHEAAGQALTAGKVYYTLRYNIDKVHNKVNTIFAQQLPQDWCMPIGFNNISKYTISFDMMYFLQPGTDYRQFGDLFEPYIYDFDAIFSPPDEETAIKKKYIYAAKVKAGKREFEIYPNNVRSDGPGKPQMFMQNGRWCYYVSLPIDRVWTFEIDDSTAIVASPLAGLLQTFAQQADYEAAQLSLVVNPLIKIFTGEIPYHNTDGATVDDAYKLSIGGRAMFEAFWNAMMAMTHTGGTAFYSGPFANIKSHDFMESANANDVSSSFQKYGMEKAGLTGLIPATDTPHAGVEEYSAKLESRYADRIYRTLERIFNHLLSSIGLKNEWQITLFGSIYLDDIIRASSLKLLDKGDLSQHYILAALDNMTILDRLSMSHTIKSCGLLDLLIPPATSYTQSSSGANTSGSNHASGTSAEGAPVKDESQKKETELQKTIAKGEMPAV